jgi:hypothetical protein
MQVLLRSVIDQQLAAIEKKEANGKQEELEEADPHAFLSALGFLLQ